MTGIKLKVGSRVKTKYDGVNWTTFKGCVPAGSVGKVVQLNSTHASVVFDGIQHDLPFVYIRPDLELESVR